MAHSRKLMSAKVSALKQTKNNMNIKVINNNHME